MPYLPTPDLTLNDATRPLIENNSRAVLHLERALAVLSHKEISAVRSNLVRRSDELFAQNQPLEPNLEVIYVQTLIDALTTKTAFLLKHATVVNSAFPDAVQDYQEPIATKINLIGSRMADSAVTNFIISKPDFYDNTRAEVVKVFMNAKTDTTPTSMTPINRLLEMVSKIALYRSKSDNKMPPDEVAAHYEHISKIALGIKPINALHPKTLPLHYLAFITDIDSALELEVADDLNATKNGYDRTTTAWLATIFAMLIESTYSYLTAAVRVTGSFANIIIYDTSGKGLINDVSHKGEIAFVHTDSDDTCYYNVYWQGFNSLKLSGHVTTPVRCNGVFSLNDLQVILAKIHGFDQALVVSWQTIPDKNGYEQLNA